MSASEKAYSNDSSTTVSLTEIGQERILQILNKTDKEKFESFVAMLRRNAKLKRAKITHK
ncbi:hypothetical protein ACFS5N_00910 [Mucilaginibacter ximonensis]|uniref:Uncharacterized protein n=1 Tax=Mucilaginibacter ximonensis TaxID=538021 RepID=A0ABW5Y6M4_9SPHI